MKSKIEKIIKAASHAAKAFYAYKAWAFAAQAFAPKLAASGYYKLAYAAAAE